MKAAMNHLNRAVFLLVFLGVAGCANAPVHRDSAVPLSVEDSVDLERYLGRWYEIARLPNRFEKNCEGVTADYGRRDDDYLSVTNTCRTGAPDGPVKVAKGRVRLVDEAVTAKLEVSFFGPFWGDYWILDLAPDYSLSIVGEPSGRYLWVLSRTPTISNQTRETTLRTLKAFGYDIEALYFTKQPPAP